MFRFISRSNYLYLFIIAALSLFMLSCSTESDRGTGVLNSVAPDTEVKWTLMFYLAGNSPDDIDYSGISRTISTMTTLEDMAANSQEVQILVCFSSQETNGNARIYRVTPRPYDATEQFSSELLADFGRADMSSADVLRNFVEFSVLNYPSQKQMLLIQGDANGWFGACRDVINGDHTQMGITEIRDVLLDITEGHLDETIDLLVWSAPEMATLEVMMEFAHVADYMIASPWNRVPNLSKMMSTWYYDLLSNPEMDGEELGTRMIDAIRQYAAIWGSPLIQDDLGEDFDASILSLINLFDLAEATRLAASFQEFSTELQSLWQAHPETVAEIRFQAWDEETDDSNHVDLSVFADLLLAEQSVIDDGQLLAVSENLRSAIDDAIVMRARGTADNERLGLMIYYPQEADTETLAEYHHLEVAEVSPAWADFISALIASTGERVDFTGNVHWAGVDLTEQELYFFVNTNRVGAPHNILRSRVSIEDGSGIEIVDYRALFALQDIDSVECYVGIFADLDGSQTLSSGDRYGYYDQTGGNLRTWITIHRGDVFENANVNLWTTFN